MAAKEVQDVKTTPVEERASRAGAEATRGEAFGTPDVDIYETEDALVIVSDVPGVPQKGVELSVEEGILEITARRGAPPAGEPEHRGFRPRSYYRAFRLSDRIDADGIEASLGDGVLTVTLPKSAAARPRKIEVRGD